MSGLIEPMLRQIAQHFQQVRWPTGEIFCPRCHSERGISTVTETHQRKNHPPELDVHHCRHCRYFFSDLAGTVLEKTSRPLWLWAWLVVGGNPATLKLPVGKVGSQRSRLREMADRLKDTALASDWKRALEAAGITKAFLEPYAESWAAGQGSKPRGRHAPPGPRARLA